MSRILWLGNPPAVGSGYGEQAGLFIPRLQEMGHDLAVAANYGIAMRVNWGGLTHYPTDNHWGNLTLGTYAADHQADLIVALCDAWVLTPAVWPEGTKVAVWAPVDHYPIPPAVFAVLAHERITPIAMSRFGEDWMRMFGLDPLYIPHGVDTQVFRPNADVRAQIREGLGIPDGHFLAGMVAANKGNAAIPRKGFPQAFDAFARMSEGRDDCWLYVHTDMAPASGGINLHHLAKAVGVREDRLAYPPDSAWQLGMMGRQFLASVYQAFDVLLNPSMGEGFGVPIIEAQACGVPAIVSDHSAMTELVGPGWLVSGDRWWDALQDSFFHMPSIASIQDALEEAYQRRGDETLRAEACEFAQEYDADHVASAYWAPAIDRLLGPREVGPLTAGLNRQQRRQLAKAGR